MWSCTLPPLNLSPTLESQTNVGSSHKQHYFLSVVTASVRKHHEKTLHLVFIVCLTSDDWAKSLLAFVVFQNVNSSNTVSQSCAICQLVMEFLTPMRNSGRKPCIAESLLWSGVTHTPQKLIITIPMQCLCEYVIRISVLDVVSIPSTYTLTSENENQFREL